jgi:hypothetical protein
VPRRLPAELDFFEALCAERTVWTALRANLSVVDAVASGFTTGRLSYSKVRAITRVAEPGDGVDWVELARALRPFRLYGDAWSTP